MAVPVQTGPKTYPALCIMGTGTHCRGEIGRSLALFTHLQPPANLSMGTVINLPTLSVCLTCNGIDRQYGWSNVQNASMDYAVVRYQRSSSIAHYIPQKWDGKGEIHKLRSFQDRNHTCQDIPYRTVWNFWVFRRFEWRFSLMRRYAAQVATFRRNMLSSCSGFYWDSRQPGIPTKLWLDRPEFKSRSQDIFSSPGPGRLWSPPNFHFSREKRP